MDLADAWLVPIAEEIGSGDIVSSDERDFKTYGLKTTNPSGTFSLASRKVAHLRF